MSATKYISIILIIFALQTGCNKNEEAISGEPSFGKIKILVPKSTVEDLMLDNELIKKENDSLSIILEGTFYKSAKNIPLSPEIFNDRSKIESLLSNDHYANQIDNGEMILSNWSINDQSNISEMLADEKIRTKNKKFVRQITNLKLHGILRYKGYYLALVEVIHNEYPYSAVITITKAAEGYFLTNILASDNVVHLVWTAFSGEGTIQLQ